MANVRILYGPKYNGHDNKMMMIIIIIIILVRVTFDRLNFGSLGERILGVLEFGCDILSSNICIPYIFFNSKD